MRLVTTMKVDLPSADLWRRRGPLGRFFGIEPYKVRKELVVGSTLEILDGFIRAFRAADVTNVIALKVDHATIFHDSELVDDDLDALVDAIDGRRDLLDETFDLIQLDMEQKSDDLHTVIGASISGKVVEGDPEVDMVVSARIRELDAEEGESAIDFADRIQTLLSTEGTISRHLEELEALADQLLEELEISTNAPEAYFLRPEVCVFRPSKQMLQAFASRPFEDQTVVLHDAPPPAPRSGGHRDRYSDYYFNPFDVLADLLILNAALEGRARAVPSDTIIRSFDEHRLGTMADISSLADNELVTVPPLVSKSALAAYDAGHVPTH